MAAEQCREGVAEKLAGGLAQHRAHPVADVGDAIVAVDRPQPADTALLIFLEQQGRAFALAADIGVHLELVEGPSGDGHHTGDRDAQREQDRQLVLERDRMAAEQQGATDAASEHRHPRHCALRHDHEAEAADAKAGHHRGGNDLRTRLQRREQVSGRLRNVTARTTASPMRNQAGTRRPDRPTQVIDWVRANCMATMLTRATAPTQPNSHVDLG